jgi:hypothetical protein
MEEELRMLFKKVKQCGPKAAVKPDESKGIHSRGILLNLKYLRLFP